MLKFSIAAGSLGLMALALPMQAQAQYGYPYSDPGVRNVQCERQKSDNSAAGTIVGVLAGALIGGAIGNEISDDNDGHRYRGGGYGYGRGYGGGRGYHGGHRGNDDNDGEVIAGALIGAFVGGAAGNSLASGSSGDCAVAYAPNYSSSPSGSIPRTTQGLYGGPETMGQGSSYPAAYPSEPSYPSYPDYRDEPRYQEPARDCRVIQRETRLPDGQVQRDPVTACWNETTRDWRVQDGYSDGY